VSFYYDVVIMTSLVGLLWTQSVTAKDFG